MPAHVAEDGDLGSWITGVTREVALDELGLGDHVVAEEEQERTLAGSRRAVPRRPRAGLLLDEDTRPIAHGRGRALVGAVAHDDRLEALDRLGLQRRERALEDLPPVAGRNRDGDVFGA